MTKKPMFLKVCWSWFVAKISRINNSNLWRNRSKKGVTISWHAIVKYSWLSGREFDFTSLLRVMHGSITQNVFTPWCLLGARRPTQPMNTLPSSYFRSDPGVLNSGVRNDSSSLKNSWTREWKWSLSDIHLLL